MESDPFEYTMGEALQPVTDEFAQSIREKLVTIKERYPHKQSTVDSCLAGIAGEPTLARILVAAYLLNGGVSLKFKMDEEPIRRAKFEAEEFDRMLKEITEDLEAMPEAPETPAILALPETPAVPALPELQAEPEAEPEIQTEPEIQAEPEPPGLRKAMHEPLAFTRAESSIRSSSSRRLLSQIPIENTGIAPNSVDWNKLTLE